MLFYLALPGVLVLFALYSILWRNPLHALLILLPWVILTPAIIMISFIWRELLPLSRKYQKGQQTARSLLIFIGNSFFMVFIGVWQTFAIKRIFSYGLFLLGVLILSVVAYYLLRLLSGEIRPLLPSDEPILAENPND